MLETIVNSWWFGPLILWDVIWKGIAMWKAGRNNQVYWFIALLVVNSVGILPIVYLVRFQKDETGSSEIVAEPKKQPAKKVRKQATTKSKRSKKKTAKK